MNRLITIALSLLIALGATAKTVTVNTPGTLASVVGEKQKYKIKSLKVVGQLNGDDLRLLREMAGSDTLQHKTPGRLVKLDLSQASFANGGGYYIVWDGYQRPKAGYTIPKFLFRNTIIEEVVLPTRTDTLDTGAFEYSRLKSIKLPNNIVIANWVFNHDHQLEEIQFPEYVRHIGLYNFYGCKNLKNIVMHDVLYLPYHCFDGAAIETFTLTGDLMHVDMEPFINCPNLRKAEFLGTVVSTGSPSVANKCPKLETVVFGNIMECFFNSAVECPLLKKCIVNGQAIFGDDKNELITLNRQPSAQLANIVGAAFDKFSDREKNRDNAIWQYLVADTEYDLACVYGLAGNKEKALEHLEGSVNAGYSNYTNIAKDTDLEILHGDARFDELVEEARKTGDKLLVLKSAGSYVKGKAADYEFTYQPASDENLKRVREFFNLDSIAGIGDEISRIKNIMYWLHDQIPHNGSNGFPDNTDWNSIDLYKACKAQSRSLNCRGLAIVLNEMYLAMGWPSRFLTCLPRDYNKDRDCHVINCVWSFTLGKWIWMDPTFSAYVSDENGNLLNQREVRQRLIDGKTLVLNEDANWNHKTKQTAEEYLQYYMAKNLYYISAHISSEYNAEYPGSSKTNPTVTLCPEGGRYHGNSGSGVDVFDDDYFWQAPKLK